MTGGATPTTRERDPATTVAGYNVTMSDVELIILGTSSQTPTVERNHNGYLLRWGPESILFDPGEGTQRQLARAGLSASSIHRICLTHFHGDHTFGLPGVLNRLELDQVRHGVDLHYPASGEHVLGHLLGATLGEFLVPIRRHPAEGSGIAAIAERYVLRHEPLHHRVDALGWRVDEPDDRRILPDRAAALGLTGPDIGRVQRDGRIEVDGRTVALEEISEPRRGRSVAVVMDTAWCDGALALADDVDLLLCESTFLSSEEDLAAAAGHLTAAQAGRLAAEAGARRLVLTHFSQRYRDLEPFGIEARRFHDDVVVAHDLDVVDLPTRP